MDIDDDSSDGDNIWEQKLNKNNKNQITEKTNKNQKIEENNDKNEKAYMMNVYGEDEDSDSSDEEDMWGEPKNKIKPIKMKLICMGPML